MEDITKKVFEMLNRDKRYIYLLNLKGNILLNSFHSYIYITGTTGITFKYSDSVNDRIKFIDEEIINIVDKYKSILKNHNNLINNERI